MSTKISYWFYTANCTSVIQSEKILWRLGGDVEQPWLVSTYDVIHKTGYT